MSGRKVESAALQLLAAITPAEHDISIVQEHLGDTVDSGDAGVDLVGITAMTIQARRAYEIADAYRRAGKTVVMGGIHPSVQPDEALQHADAVVVGEAEPVWAQVLADTAAGKLGGLYRGQEFADLSQLPNYRRDLFPKRSTFSLASVQAARGCPYDCSFCSATLFAGRKYRFRPVENVIAEIKSMRTRLIFFLDDNIFSNEAYCRALFTELKKLNIIWVGQASLHLTASNPSLLALAVQSGCISLFVGIESLSEANLRATGSLAKNKASTPKQMAASLRVLHDHGIVVMAGVIFGFDDDDPGVFDRTREFLLDSRVGHGSFSALTPFPGTKLFAELHAQARITTYDWAKYDGITPVFIPKLMSPEQLQEGTRQIGVNF
ncbi:MAG TPA: radical SAM protein, partial [Polyangia bacterium]